MHMIEEFQSQILQLFEEVGRAVKGTITKILPPQYQQNFRENVNKEAPPS